MPSAKQPKKIVLFIDRSLGKKQVARALREKGAAVKIHDDLFLQNAEDRDWLLTCGRKSWIVLTKDSRIRYRAIEREAVRQSGTRVFVLVSSRLRGNEMAEAFVRALGRIGRMANNNDGPFIAKVYKDGKVSMWIDFSE